MRERSFGHDLTCEGYLARFRQHEARPRMMQAQSKTSLYAATHPSNPTYNCAIQLSMGSISATARMLLEFASLLSINSLSRDLLVLVFGSVLQVNNNRRSK